MDWWAVLSVFLPLTQWKSRPKGGIQFLFLTPEIKDIKATKKIWFLKRKTCQLIWSNVSSRQTTNECQSKPSSFSVLWRHLVAASPRPPAVRLHHVTSNSLMQHEINVRFHFHLHGKSGPVPRERRHPPPAAAGARRTCQAVRTSRWEPSGLLQGMETIKKW